VVKRLRRKLANLGATVTIHAVRGVRGVGFHLLLAG
jgi:DNA-binding response OmpR family regulator